MAIPNYSMATVPQCVGRSLGRSEWVMVSQDRIDQFATCTGDRQWIHVDVEPRKTRKSIRRIDRPWLPHLGLGRCAGDRAWRHSPGCCHRTKLWFGQGSLYRTGEVRSVRLQTNLISAEPQSNGRMLLKLQCALEIEGEDKPALVAEVLCMLVGKPEGS